MLRTYQIGNYDSDFLIESKRQAVRGLVVTPDEKVLVMTYGKYDFSVLPGGGLGKGETFEQAFRREILEETGYQCRWLSQLCQIEDYRKDEKLLQIHHGFVAGVSESKLAQNLDEDEKSDKVYLELLTLEELVKRFSVQQPHTEQQSLLRQRDRIILQEALTYLHQVRK
ncbi:NUDIX hydrolase [Streptococcus sp. S784/96/1]|uniref:NUDIX hydrolase n=1 Tax=Streptococcus sp. S784/96/1 TaxID=2653499 RepID=UPI001389C2D3|nr:NUDIX hydrolase [Streptococcus sp. S784/96/1]